RRYRRGGFGCMRARPVNGRAQRWRRRFGVRTGLVLLGRLILLGRPVDRVRRARLPDVLHEPHALLAQEPLDSANGVALAIEQVADAAQQVDVVRPIVPAPAPAFHRLDLAEAALPEPQHMLRNIEFLRHFADGPKCVGRLFHRRPTPSAPGLNRYFASGSPLMRCLRIADALNTTTRRAEIGTSLPVLGLRPTRWPFLRTTNEPKEDNFTVSPRSRQSVI